MNRPRVTPHQPPCSRGADAAGRMFRFDCAVIRKKKFTPVRRKKMPGRPRAIATRPRMRDSLPVAHVPCVRALRGRLHGQRWRGSSVPTSAWPNRHGRAGDRLERPTLCPGPSTPLTISRWSGSRQQVMLSSSRRVRAARPWKRSRTWILRELGSSSRARATRFATLGASAREA